jgi:hypothetical protein
MRVRPTSCQAKRSAPMAVLPSMAPKAYGASMGVWASIGLLWGYTLVWQAY